MARAFKPYDLKVSADTIHTRGYEPQWEGVAVTESTRMGLLIRALNWYNYACDSKDSRRFFEDWITLYRGESAGQDLKILARASDRHLSTSMSYLARLQVKGFAITDSEQARIWSSIAESAARRVEVAEDTPAVQQQPAERIGVQERMDLQVNQAVIEIEEIVGSILRGVVREGKTANITGFARFRAVHFKKLAAALAGSTAELRELAEARTSRDHNNSTQQLLEGYRFVSAKSLKAAIAFLDDCEASAGRLAIEKKVARVRKAKPVDRAKLVRKLKYLGEHKELKITSIKPIEVLGASEVWVYDVRRRKLGVYRGEFDKSIMAKGTSLVGIANKGCIQKTLRKPETQLAEFMKLGKNQLRKWFDAIKGVEHTMKPRTNEHTVLLRVA